VVSFGEQKKSGKTTTWSTNIDRGNGRKRFNGEEHTPHKWLWGGGRWRGDIRDNGLPHQKRPGELKIKPGIPVWEAANKINAICGEKGAHVATPQSKNGTKRGQCAPRAWKNQDYSFLDKEWGGMQTPREDEDISKLKRRGPRFNLSGEGTEVKTT